MDPYDVSANGASVLLTESFSTSFSSATKLFPKEVRQHIYNIYGLVRVADEIVDTYQGEDASNMLDALEVEVYATMGRGFSANPIVHSFSATARAFKISKALIKPFFESMRMDLTKKSYTDTEYRVYIYGSAEVVGLMCLKVFVGGDTRRYKELEAGAQALGSAFQKVNFLRDIKDDYQSRGRYYFPIGSYESFSDSEKQAIESDIERDFSYARDSIKQLPSGVRVATELAFDYYTELLKQIKGYTAEDIKRERISVPRYKKMMLALKARVPRYGA